MPETTDSIPDEAQSQPAPFAVVGSAADTSATPSRNPSVVLELRVRNHPGTMSHLTSLFARRAFNLDAIVCVPIGDGGTSRMLLLVGAEPRLEQVERQLAKLYDVLSIQHRPDLDAASFARLAAW